MLYWFRHKNYPDFWNQYRNHFIKKKSFDLDITRFIVFDTETTGLHIKNDRILSIGGISIISNTMDVSDSIELYLKQDTFNPETVEIHGILKDGNNIKINEKQAIIEFLEYIRDAVLIAHHASFDIAMINEILARQRLPKLKNKALDTGVLFKKTELCHVNSKPYSLDELCAIFNIKKHDRHTASGDAYITGLIFLKILGELTSKKRITLKDLFYNRNRPGLL
ncbi:PolC-type DNA polymerase III [Aquimarina sp. AU119]|uniref:3'-5' exonuclease n=1 Tax=Aquimarina sp. AU119 TaxID=2108528 RepID=UPI000D691175|nr:3'-5' exonuclease [Aquimarina sp. AU119]